MLACRMATVATWTRGAVVPGKSMVPLLSASTSLIMSCSSDSEGFWPRERMTVPSSLVVICPASTRPHQQEVFSNVRNTSVNEKIVEYKELYGQGEYEGGVAGVRLTIAVLVL